MKSIVLFLSLFVASSSFAQITSTMTSHRFGIKLRGIGATPAIEKVAPLNAKLAFSIDIPSPSTSLNPGSQDGAITGNINNLTGSPLTINFHRIQTLPMGWTTAVCFGVRCLISSADSGKPPFVFNANESAPFILHFYSDSTTFLATKEDSILVNLLVYQVGGTQTDTLWIHLKALTMPANGVSEKILLPTAPTIASIYPNPIAGGSNVSAQIYLSSASKGSLAIYDILGNLVRSESQVVMQKGVNVMRLDVAGLASGSYQLVCELSPGVKISRPFEISR